jgi:hypothetical protein
MGAESPVIPPGSVLITPEDMWKAIERTVIPGLRGVRLA